MRVHSSYTGVTAMQRLRHESQWPLVSIIVLNLNGLEHLDTCLKSVAMTTYPNFEVILVDNGSTDGSVEHVAKRYPSVRIIRNNRNLGFAAANNVGIRLTKGDYVILLNNDTEVDPNWVSEMVQVAESDPLIAACQPKIMNFYDRKKFEYAGAAGGFIDIYGYPLARGRVFDFVEIDHGQYDNSCNIFWASGAAMLIKRQALRKTGLLDELFFIYHEETDLCWRFHLSGYRVVFVPSAKIFHKGGATYKRKPYASWYLLHRNDFVMLMKNYSTHNLVKITVPRLTLEFVAACKFAFERDMNRVWVMIKAMFWVLKNLGAILKERSKVQTCVRTSTDDYVKKFMIKKSISLLFFTKKMKTFHDLKRYL